MQYIKNFIINLLILISLGVVLFIIFPDLTKQVFQLYGMLFGPIAILLLIVAALPRKKRRHKSDQS